jgi:hypothetical protein
MDVILQRYSWDWWTYMEQPEEIIQELMEVIQGEAQHYAAERRKRESAQRGGGGFSTPTRPTVVPARSHEELMQQAAREGFLDAPEE